MTWGRHGWRVLWLSLAAGLPATIVALWLLWTTVTSAKIQITLTLVVLAAWIGLPVLVRQRVVRPLQTLANVLGALRRGDYSMRAAPPGTDDALGLAMLEVNAIADSLREHRLGALEATALLRKVMDEIEVALFSFDEENKLSLVNRAGERLLGSAAERLRGRSAESLGLADALVGPVPRTLEVGFAGSTGRWEVRRGTFRQRGRPHKLVALTDLSHALREEERLAWQRLVRVLSHEINNSLAPIQSITDSMKQLRSKTPRPDDWEHDLARGLEVIGSRAEALQRFMATYARLARLPRPALAPVRNDELVDHVCGLERRLEIRVEPGPTVEIPGDADQLQQMLINLVTNAADAAKETGGEVIVTWELTGSILEIRVIDEGPGVADTANLFVPFFSTKPEGSGIGLALCQQIAEGHGGTVTLENRAATRGCQARVRLPLSRPAPDEPSPPGPSTTQSDA
jgi:PAS domain S-box-containing protein